MIPAGKPVDINHGGFLVIRKPWPSMMRTIYKNHDRYLQYWNDIPGVYFAGDGARRDGVDRQPVGRLVTRITSDVETLNELFTSGVVSGLGDLFTLVAIGIGWLFGKGQ